MPRWANTCRSPPAANVTDAENLFLHFDLHLGGLLRFAIDKPICENRKKFMYMDLSRYADWTPQDNGIWKGNSDQQLSYPEVGNEACFQFEDTSWWFQHRNSVISSVVCRYFPVGVFFDVGGGNGCVTKALQDRGIVSVLVEPGRDGPQNAVKRGCRHVVQSLWNLDIVYPEVAPAVGLFYVV